MKVFCVIRIFPIWMMKICSFVPLLSMLNPKDENLSIHAKHI